MNSPISDGSSVSRERAVFMVLFAGFAVTGVVTTLLGPSLPVLMARWSLDDAHAGVFFTTQFLASLLGVGLSSALLAAKGYRPALFLGFAAMALGVAGLNFRQETLALTSAAIYGVGFGAVSPATNLWVGETAGVRRSSALNLLNLGWGAGALGCAPLVFAAIRSNSFPILLYAIAGAACLLCLLVLVMPLESHRSARASDEPDGASVTTGLYAAAALGALFFLYEGVESGVSGWAAAHAKRVESAPGSTWALTPMFFWAAMLVGRALASIILLRVTEARLVFGGLAVTAVGTFVLLRATSQTTVIAGVLMAGFGMSTLYPIFIAWLAKWYGARARGIGGVLFALAALGGAVVPPLIGFISTRGGGLRAGLLVPLAGCFVMLGVLALLHRQRLV
jgi:fucose permease